MLAIFLQMWRVWRIEKNVLTPHASRKKKEVEAEQ
jgi:hypothetical protein